MFERGYNVHAETRSHGRMIVKFVIHANEPRHFVFMRSKEHGSAFTIIMRSTLLFTIPPRNHVKVEKASIKPLACYLLIEPI